MSKYEEPKSISALSPDEQCDQLLDAWDSSNESNLKRRIALAGVGTVTVAGGGPVIEMVVDQPASAADIKTDDQGRLIITVEKKDTFSEIAEEINVSQTELAQQNGFDTPPEIIHPGDQYAAENSNSYDLTYTIGKRETLTSIANKFGTTVDELVEANPDIDDPDVIFAGQTLVIPNAGRDLPKTIKYQAQPGDTISEIEARAGLQPGTFKLLNPGIKGDKIYAGRVYQVPEGSDELFVPEPATNPGASQPPAPGVPKVNGETNPGGVVDVIGTYTVEQFMAAIAGNESGASTTESADPEAYNESFDAFGYFQILPENWPVWSVEAFGKVVEQTPENQIHVARFKMLQYYEAYGHNWTAVAIAWFAGPGRAQRYLDGDYSVLELGDGLSSVRHYVTKLAGNIGKIDPLIALPEFKDIPQAITPGVNDKPTSETTDSPESKPAEKPDKTKEFPIDPNPNLLADGTFVPLNPVEIPDGHGEFGTNGNVDPKILVELGPLWPGHRLQKEAAKGFLALNDAFYKKFGRNLELTDSYRDFPQQVDTERRKGKYAAEPGTSKHGQGLAIDFASNINHFTSEEYKWMFENATKFGFENPPLLRDGYRVDEAWHWEYGTQPRAIEQMKVLQELKRKEWEAVGKYKEQVDAEKKRNEKPRPHKEPKKKFPQQNHKSNPKGYERRNNYTRR